MKTINRTLILLLGIMVSTCFAADIIGPLLHEVKVPCNAMGFASIAGKYYAAWTPSDHSAVHFMYSDDGANFKESAVTPTDGYGGASIASYKGHLYLAFHGGDANHSLNIVEVR